MPPKSPKFDLKLKFQKMFEIGIIISILVTIFAFRYFPEIKHEELPNEPEKTYIEIIDVISTDLKQKPPLPPKPIIPLIEELEEEDLPDVIFENSDLTIKDNPGDAKPVFIEEKDEILPPFTFVENMPEIIGGLAALQSKVVYPEIAVRAGVQGRVLLRVIIGKDGNPTDIKVLKSLGAGCDESAIEALLSTKFLPGTQRGKAVRVSIVVPISFVLNN